MNDVGLEFDGIRNNNLLLRKRMEGHYSKPKGFVGRNICYAVYYNNIYYGNIVAGSATMFLPGRDEYFGITKNKLGTIINNVFYNISKVDNKYPKRNFTTYVLIEWMKIVQKHWYIKYGNTVKGFETLIELPRTGELYRKAGFEELGVTKGYTCKRVAGIGTDNWSGKRVWNTKELKPKLILVKKVQELAIINE